MVKFVLLIGVTLFVFGQAQEAPAEAATADKPAENGGDAKNAAEPGDKKEGRRNMKWTFLFFYN